MSVSLFPPGPRSSLFGVEQYLASQRDPLGFLQRIVHKYGDIAHFKIGKRHVYLLNHPEYIKDVLVSHYDNFLKGDAANPRKDFLGKRGLLMTEGNFHKRQRQLTLPAFRHERFVSYGTEIVKLAADVSSAWGAGDCLDVLEAMRQITLRVTSQTLFKSDIDAEHKRIIAAFRANLRGFSSFRPMIGRIYDRLSFMRRQQMAQAQLTVVRLITEIITERRRENRDRGDLLSMLLARNEVEDNKFTGDRQLLDEVVTLFIASFENIAIALTWSWYLLARHPAVQQKLHQELDSVLDGRLPTAADLPQLVYTRMVLEEVMRLYPPFPRMVRTAARDYRVGAYTVPAGSLVVISQYLMHRDPRYYAAPERFDPERWTPEAKRARPVYAYFPFGGGPRRCIGDNFAYMEGVLVLATLASRWKLCLTSPDPVETVATHFLHPRGTLAMTAERRSV